MTMALHQTKVPTGRRIAFAGAGAVLLAAMGILAAASLTSATNAKAQMYGWNCQPGWHAINYPSSNGYRCVPDNY
jgi:Spy/CpxP family protein refolding chaperone